MLRGYTLTKTELTPFLKVMLIASARLVVIPEPMRMNRKEKTLWSLAALDREETLATERSSPEYEQS